MRPNFEELQTMWVYGYSKSALNQAVRFVDAMEDAQPRSTQLHALASAAVVAYGRPFTSSRITAKKSVIPLRDVRPPSHLKAAHQRLLDVRNKEVGHQDATATRGGKSRNVLVIKREGKTAMLYPTGLHDIEQTGREDIRELCSYFVEYCDTKLRPLMESYQAEILRRPPGTYELMLCEPPDDWIRPYDDSWMIPMNPPNN